MKLRVGRIIRCQDVTTKFNNFYKENFYADGAVDEKEGYEDVMLRYEHAPKTL